MNLSLVFPDQLFYSNPSLFKDQKVFILKHPHYFTGFSYNKKKILMHLMSLEHYKNFLISKGYDVKLVELEKLYSFFEKHKDHKIIIHTCEISNFEICSFLNELLTKNIETQYYKSPMFYESLEDISLYFSGRQRLLQQAFYKNLRKKHNVLVDEIKSPVGGKWSFDSENRKKIPDSSIPKSKKSFVYDVEILDKSKLEISNLYSDNIGTLEGFNFPVNREQALENLEFFLYNKFNNFGIYQDAIFSSETYLYHSNLSSSLNIGLITPDEVIEKAIEHSKKFNIPINSLEGFIRQILGWREFIRGIYITKNKYQESANFWNSKNHLPSSFYKSQTSLLPLDDSIDKSIAESYAHHIERLMIQGNLMLLLEIKPKFVHQWFMELFIDSYDWVMGPNVFGMSLYSDGGIMSTKPYISSSNYILGMSNYKKGSWTEIWDALFWNFIHKHKNKIKEINRMSFMLRLLDKKSKKQIYSYQKLSDNFKESIF